MPRNAALNLVLLICIAVAAAPALAGKSGGGGGSGGSGGGGGTPSPPPSSSIAIATVDGGVMSATTQSPSTKLGDALTFATTAAGLAGWEYPMVAVSCFQDVNGDGAIDTNLVGPDLVYTELDHPDATFTLGGYSSIWTQRGGGPAVCRADLDAYGWKGGKESARVLASTSTWTAAG
jgi:hypothetical protein